MRFRIQTICTVISTWFIACSGLCQESVPVGITYLNASDEFNANMSKKLRQSLLVSPPSLRSYLSDKIPPTLRDATLVGYFMTDRLRRKGELNVTGITSLVVNVQLGEGLTTQHNGLVLQNEQARAAFDTAFGKVFRFDKINLRKLIPSEMQMIWQWISWDLSEPIFVAENGSDVIIFDFREDGSLQWVEDISEPCVRFKGSNKEGKTLVSECFCLDGKPHSCGGG